MNGLRRLRRARSVLVTWRQQELVLLNYLTQASASADPEAVKFLSLLEEWIRLPDLYLLLPEYTPKSIRATVRELAENTFLVSEGTPAAKRDADLDSVWSEWLPEGEFHFATKDFNYSDVPASFFKRYLDESPQPAFAKSYRKAPRIQFPRASAPNGEFERVLFARKTHRDFSRESIPLKTIATLLHHTWGVTGRIDAPPFGQLFHKTSPSAGARHPGEVYMIAMRVDGIAQGLYHYDGLHHRLARIGSSKAVRNAVRYAADQDFVADASAVFIMTAVFPRVLWKYRFARSYRVVLLDAGHLCQTFCLVATWLGLAPFCTAALRDTLIEKELGLDGIRESVLYLAAVGTLPGGRLRKSR